MAGQRGTHSARAVVRVVAALVGLLSLVVGALLAVTVVQFADAQHRIEDELNPARVELSTVLALYVDQETGERGYILTGREEFLAPYAAAGPQIEDNLRRLRTQVPASVQRRVDAMAAAHGAWLDRAAEPELAAARRGDRARAEQLVASGTGRELFDRVRAAHEATDEAIGRELQDANEHADELLRRLSYLLAFTILAFLATTVAAAVAFDRRVVRPLADLGRLSRSVADGDLQVVVRAGGPQEVAAVGEDVDTMRRHLLDELDASRRASEALVLGEPAVRALQTALSRLAPVGPGLEVAAQIDSAEGVLAGDFVDVVELDDGRVAVLLGDVSGHGPEPAVVGLRLKVALAAMLRRAPLPEALAAVRHGLAGQPEVFATIVVAVLDLESGSLSYVNAGHPAPYLLGADGTWSELAPTGPLVSAVLDDVSWDVATQPFGPGDSLLVFSDGLIEARAVDGREFGVDGVRATVEEHAERGPAGLVDQLRSAARDHAVRPRDDVTVLVVRRR